MKTSAYKLQSLLTLFLLLLVAALLSWVSVRFSLQFDLTKNSRHSLSETSISILRQIDGPIKITAYARDEPEFRDAITRYISKYQTIKPDISLSFTNPFTSPDLVRELGIHINGDLLFEYNNRVEHVHSADENVVINALIRLWRSEDRWLAYITGHGERNLQGAANHDLGEFGSYLSDRGYNVQAINLAEMNTIPDNTSVLVLAGPQLPLLEGEMQILLQYLNRGGNLLWFLDPEEPYLPSELTDYLAIEINDGTVMNNADNFIGIDDPSITVITASLYGRHPTVDDFELTSLYPGAVGLTAVDNNIWTSSPLLITDDLTWLEKSDPGEDAQFNEGSDVKGPLTIAYALNRTLMNDSAESGIESEQRVIIIGDGDFLSNTYIENAGNLDLGIRLIEWISYDERLVDIPVRAAEDTQLNLTNMTLGILGLLFLYILPLLSVSTGIFIWWRRRSI